MVALAVASAIIFAIGVTGNIQVAIYFRFYEKHTPPKYRLFIIYLAITDACSCAVSTIYLIMLSLYQYKWIFGRFLCRYTYQMSSSLASTSMWIVCGLSYVRYQSINNPLNLSMRNKKWHAHAFCIVALAMSCGASVINPVAFNYSNNSCAARESMVILEFTYSSCFFLLVGIFPIVAVLRFTWLVRKALQKHHTQFETSKGLTRHNEINNEKTERLLNISSALYILLSYPAYILGIAISVLRWAYHKTYDSNAKILTDVNMWLWMVYISNGIINCCIYAGRNPGFQKFLKQIFSSKRQST